MADHGRSHFPAWFDFSRPNVAQYRNVAGNMVDAGIDIPRFDNDLDGLPIGLIVEAGSELGQADRVRLQADAIAPTIATVFHARRTDDGSVVRRAWYTLDPQATINACLAQEGRHISVGVIEGFRRNLGGYVRFRGLDWMLAIYLGTGEGKLLADEAGRALTGA